MLVSRHDGEVRVEVRVVMGARDWEVGWGGVVVGGAQDRTGQVSARVVCERLGGWVCNVESEGSQESDETFRGNGQRVCVDAPQ